MCGKKKTQSCCCCQQSYGCGAGGYGGGCGGGGYGGYPVILIPLSINYIIKW